MKMGGKKKKIQEVKEAERGKRQEPCSRTVTPPHVSSAPDSSQPSPTKALQDGERARFTCQHGWAVEPRHPVICQSRCCHEGHL